MKAACVRSKGVVSGPKRTSPYKNSDLCTNGGAESLVRPRKTLYT